MANFSVSPQGLRFNSAPVQGSISGLYAAAQTLTFTLTNTSGVSVTITNYGFSTSTEGDAVTQPIGIYTNSDFTMVPTGAYFPITIANNGSHSFTVTYAPLRRGSGFGDIRSQIMTLFSGNKALSNGGQVLNSSGEVINYSVPVPVTVGVGGGVTEEAYDWATVNPIYWSSGNNSNMVTPGTGEVSTVHGMTPNMTLAGMDTTPHYGPMLFWATPQTGAQTSTVIAAAAATYTTGSTSVPYAISAPATLSSPRWGRSYQVLIFWGDDTLSFNLNIQARIGASTWTTVASYIGLNYSNSSGLFIGNNEGLDLQGLELRAVTSSLETNGTTYNTTTNYNIGAVITG